MGAGLEFMIITAWSMVASRHGAESSSSWSASIRQIRKILGLVSLRFQKPTSPNNALPPNPLQILRLTETQKLYSFCNLHGTLSHAMMLPTFKVSAPTWVTPFCKCAPKHTLRFVSRWMLNHIKSTVEINYHNIAQFKSKTALGTCFTGFYLPRCQKHGGTVSLWFWQLVADADPGASGSRDKSISKSLLLQQEDLNFIPWCPYLQTNKKTGLVVGHFCNPGAQSRNRRISGVHWLVSLTEVVTPGHILV